MGENSIDFDTVLDLCRHQHRRIVLAVLAGERRPLTVNDLTKTILAHNHHAPLTEVSGEVLSEIQIALHHAHVPRLESVGVVEYDADRKLVTPTEEFDQLQPALAAVVDVDPALDAPLTL